MIINKVGAEHVIAFHRGFKEPRFLESDVPDFKTCRPIKEQEKFVYCCRTMEGEHFAKNNAAVHEFMYKMYKRISDSNPQILDDSQVIPQGRVQTGSDCGNPYVSYVEYMTAALETRPAIRGDELYTIS